MRVPNMVPTTKYLYLLFPKTITKSSVETACKTAGIEIQETFGDGMDDGLIVGIKVSRTYSSGPSVGQVITRKSAADLKLGTVFVSRTKRESFLETQPRHEQQSL